MDMDTFIYQTVCIISAAYIVFCAVHAAQHVADPAERGGWVAVILIFTVVGATLYLLTKYRKFLAIGKGKWIFGKKTGYFPSKTYFCLSDTEKTSSLLPTEKEVKLE
jgi:hypothetical protein